MAVPSDSQNRQWEQGQRGYMDARRVWYLLSLSRGALQILPGATPVSTLDGFFIFIYLLFSLGMEGTFTPGKYCAPGLSSQLRGHWQLQTLP